MYLLDLLLTCRRIFVIVRPFCFPGAGEDFPELAERLRSIEAARSSDTQRHRRSLAAVEAQTEEKHALLAWAEKWIRQLEADLATREAGRQVMEEAMTGNFLAPLTYNHDCSVIHSVVIFAQRCLVRTSFCAVSSTHVSRSATNYGRRPEKFAPASLALRRPVPWRMICRKSPGSWPR